MRSMHPQACKACTTGYRRSHETLCDRCHLANGGKLCQCGAHIERTDSVCRGCWTSQTRNLPGSMLSDSGHREYDASVVNLDEYRMETSQVESASIEHDGDWSHLLSPKAKAGLEEWRAKGKYGEAQS